MRRVLFNSLPAIVALTVPAFAHFPFIVPDVGGATAKLLMSETLEPEPEVDIALVSGTTLSLRGADGKETPLKLAKGEHCMLLDLPGSGTRVVHGLTDLGVMKRGRPNLLLYYPKSILGDPFDVGTQVGEKSPVELVPVRDERGFRIKLLIGGKPAPQTELHVIAPVGDDANYITDAGGLTEVIEVAGRYGAWARYWVDQPGERNGESYEQVRHYATIVFDVPSKPNSAVSQGTQTPAVSLRTPLPEAVASFGAVESNGWLYVYGGHTSDRHDYSTASISGKFHRLNLNGAGAWEELAGGVHAQGLNLAAFGGLVYRAGGMEPRNAPGEPDDRYSIDEVARFDPSTNAWTKLPPLPRPRSSHDVVVVNNELLVIGGWWMKGRGVATEWLDTIDVLALGANPPTWRSIPQPFKRRALIVAALGSKVFVIGGFDDDDTALSDVDIYDHSTGKWTQGPPIPGVERNGFGPAACTHNGSIYLSIATGEMFRLSDDLTTWQPFARTTPRIVHRLVPFGNEILVIGGASEERMRDLIEAVHVDPKRSASDVNGTSGTKAPEKSSK